jgi:hypothetical protein
MGNVTVNADGLRVHYGTRRAGDEANFGTYGDVGSQKELVFEIKGTDFTAGVYTGPTLTLPAGFTHRGGLAEVTEVFALGGTTPTINVGVSTTEATNRMAQLSEAQAEALGVYNMAGAGTLAANTPLAAAATISIALGGTTPTITSAGKLRITVKYDDLTPAV